MSTSDGAVESAAKPNDEMSTNPYFALEEPRVITDIESLLTLNVRKTYYRPGDETAVQPFTIAYSRIETAGIFRGQTCDWSLMPRCFRDQAALEGEFSFIERISRWTSATQEFNRFCERAEMQNPRFPAAIADRMSIAQHFGVSTPLLDWSQSILPAAYFAIRDVLTNEDFAQSGRVFVYHVIDERLLDSGLPSTEKLYDFGKSAFIRSYHIDRRIERQNGVFTFHPHPAHRPPKIPARVYALEYPLVFKLRELMEGLRFTQDYYFPDYAGIARAVSSWTRL